MTAPRPTIVPPAGVLTSLEETAARARQAITELISQAAEDPRSSYPVLVHLLWTDTSVLGACASALADLANSLTAARQTQASCVLAAVVKELRRITGDHPDVTRVLQILAPYHP
ncbi:hypothetical protein [Streptomyces lunalinharesii]|uniref:Uncharacterized protein n=1 Tax=Streptomyces lunalinharesii TaxID=333384 RepID=A0ABP6F8Y7_9ACTN